MQESERDTRHRKRTAPLFSALMCVLRYFVASLSGRREKWGDFQHAIQQSLAFGCTMQEVGDKSIPATIVEGDALTEVVSARTTDNHSGEAVGIDCAEDESERSTLIQAMSSEDVVQRNAKQDCRSTSASHVTFNVAATTKMIHGVEENECEDSVFQEPATCSKLRKRWGWVVVMAAWIIMIPVAGTLSSFGTIVSSLSAEFNATKLETGWIASLAFGFTVGTCPLSTPLFTVYGGRKLALFGVVSGAGSIFITSFVPIVHIMFLTYSAMFGVSANFIYNSAMSLTGQYFPSEHQALATCLASAGISFGTILMNPFSEYLIGEVGWRNTFRILSGMILVVGLACAAAFAPIKTKEQKLVSKLKHTNPEDREKVIERVCESHKDLDKQVISESLQNCTESKISLAAHEIKKNVFDTKMYDCSVCSNPPFILWMLGTLFWSLSFLFPLIFLIDYMSTLGIEPSQGAWVMTAYGIAEFGGRILCAIFADKLPFGFAYVYACSCGLMGISTLLAPQGASLLFMYMYGVAVGLNSGILNSLMFTTTMQLFGNQRGSHVWGYINVMLALGMVVGPLTAGGIYDLTHSYKASFYIGGGTFIIGAITMLLLPVAQNYFPMKEREARGKREDQQLSVVKTRSRIVNPRSSLRSMLLTKEIGRRQSAMEKPKWKTGMATELKELDELHEAYEAREDKGDDNSPGDTVISAKPLV